MKFKKLIKTIKKTERTLFAVLIDPDKYNPLLIRMANDCNVDCFLVGGSYLNKGNIDTTVKSIKSISHIPVVLFPGDENQLSKYADGVFLPSLLSGRNPDYLIGKQILMAPIIKEYKLRHAPMAYLLLNGDRVSSTEKITKTKPLKTNETQLIINTAIAAQQLGFELLYLEAGSGAKKNIPIHLIQNVKKQTDLPLIVGGGIDSAEKAMAYVQAKVNMLVVGNALEKNVNLISEIGASFKSSTRKNN